MAGREQFRGRARSALWHRAVVRGHRILHPDPRAPLNSLKGFGPGDRPGPGFQGQSIDGDLAGGDTACVCEVVAGLRALCSGRSDVAGAGSPH
jgi:hypothetical protein